MSSSPQPHIRERIRYHRHLEPTGWKAMPLAAKILIGLCLLVLIGILAAPRTGWLKKRQADVMRPAAKAAVTQVTQTGATGLELHESVYMPDSHTVKGVVVNKSDTFYRDIVISYTPRDRQGVSLGVVEATLSGLGPHQKAAFQTDPMPRETAMFDLREIAGDPR